jgi:hypothetical protein
MDQSPKILSAPPLTECPDLSHLGNGERDLAQPKGPQDPTERERGSQRAADSSQGSFEPFGKRRKEFGGAEGCMATERAGASESTPTPRGGPPLVKRTKTRPLTAKPRDSANPICGIRPRSLVQTTVHRRKRSQNPKDPLPPNGYSFFENALVRKSRLRYFGCLLFSFFCSSQRYCRVVEPLY